MPAHCTPARCASCWWRACVVQRRRPRRAGRRVGHRPATRPRCRAAGGRQGRARRARAAQGRAAPRDRSPSTRAPYMACLKVCRWGPVVLLKGRAGGHPARCATCSAAMDARRRLGSRRRRQHGRHGAGMACACWPSRFEVAGGAGSTSTAGRGRSSWAPGHAGSPRQAAICAMATAAGGRRRVKMITGDHADTPSPIRAAELGIAADGDRVLTGRQLAALDDAGPAPRCMEVDVRPGRAGAEAAPRPGPAGQRRGGGDDRRRGERRPA